MEQGKACMDCTADPHNYLCKHYRLTDLADGFATYTTTTKIIEQQAAAFTGPATIGTESNGVSEKANARKRASAAEAESAVTLAKDSADIFLARNGNLVQNLFVEESVLAASAQVKDALRGALVDGPRRFRDTLPLGIGAVLPRLPLEDGVEPFLKKTNDEEKAQNLVGKISSFFPQPSVPSMPFGESVAGEKMSEVSSGANPGLDSFSSLDPEQAAYVAKELRENVPKYAPLVGRLGSKVS
jgi:hypothetical protein